RLAQFALDGEPLPLLAPDLVPRAQQAVFRLRESGPAVHPALVTPVERVVLLPWVAVRAKRLGEAGEVEAVCVESRPDELLRGQHDDVAAVEVYPRRLGAVAPSLAVLLPVFHMVDGDGELEALVQDASGHHGRGEDAEPDADGHRP